MRDTVAILGIPVDNINMSSALDRIEDFIDQDRKMGKTHQVVTVNADFVANAMSDPELLDILRNADLATPDGMPVVWGSRLLGVPMKDRLAGADLVPAIAQRAAQKGYSVYLLGAAPGIAAQAANILQERFPGLNIAGVLSPPFAPLKDMDPAIIDKIKLSKPDILLVAFGNPKQEKWIRLYGNQLGVPLMMGVGGSLDFLTGNIRRAPVWMQRSGLEWLYRIFQEPRRLWRLQS